jgi:hypothetical protein
MKPDALLEQLEAAAEQLSVKVSYEQLQASVGHGGLCRVKGEYRVIIDKRATPQEKVSTLASSLGRFDISTLAIPKKVREVLAFYSDRHSDRRGAPRSRKAS